MNVEIRDEAGEVLVETRPLWKKQRYLLVFLAFFGFINIYTLRFNLSVAIVSMTEIRNVTNEDGSVTEEPPYFDWNTKQQGLILSSFFYGYICTQVGS